MSEAIFTKGPWRRDFKNIGHVTAENGAIVAKCQRLTSLCNLQANAHLIAAALELYEALQACIDHGSMTGHDFVVEQAHAALAKARGEA